MEIPFLELKEDSSLDATDTQPLDIKRPGTARNLSGDPNKLDILQIISSSHSNCFDVKMCDCSLMSSIHVHSHISTKLALQNSSILEKEAKRHSWHSSIPLRFLDKRLLDSLFPLSSCYKRDIDLNIKLNLQ